MSNDTNDEEIVAFLSKAKSLLSKNKYDFVPRKKNLQSLAQYGLTVKDVKDEIFDLVVSDYYKGPKQDFDKLRPGDIWEFKKNVDEIKFYIKLKIVSENDSDVLKCLAFHEDDFS